MLKINLKKTSIIDSDEDIIGFNDESRFNNVHNSGKIWHKKGRKNIIIKTLNRESVNVIGFHSVNGHSILSFPDKTNRITFCLHLIEVRGKNMSNRDIQGLSSCWVLGLARKKFRLAYYFGLYCPIIIFKDR